jgi:hypothetical protein
VYTIVGETSAGAEIDTLVCALLKRRSSIAGGELGVLDVGWDVGRVDDCDDGSIGVCAGSRKSRHDSHETDEGSGEESGLHFERSCWLCLKGW